MDIVDFHLAVWQYTEETSASETSGRRTVMHNLAVGGVPDSKHLVGRARDVVYDHPLSPEHRKQVAAKCGLVIRIEADHDHLETPD